MGRLLWKIKDILSNVLRTRKYSVLGGTRPEPSNNTESNPRPLRDSLFISDGRDPPFCLGDVKQIQLRERTMAAKAARESHTNNSCTINTVTGNQKDLLLGLFQKESSRNNTLPEAGEGTFPSLAFPSRPLKALQIGLGSTFPAALHPSINAAD